MSEQQYSEEQRRQRVLSTLDKSFDEARSIMLKGLGDESWRVRKETVSVVGQRSDIEELIPDLIYSMGIEDNAGLRNASFQCLQKIGEPAQKELIKHINTDDEDLRKFIVDLLGFINTDQARDIMLQLLDDENYNIRLSAVEGLGRIGNHESVEKILPLLEEDNSIMQSTVLDAIHQIGLPMAAEKIAPLLDNPLLGQALVKLLSLSNQDEISQMLISIATGNSYGFTARYSALAYLLPTFEEQGLLNFSHEQQQAIAKIIERLIDSENDDQVGLGVSLARFISVPTLLHKILIVPTHMPRLSMQVLQTINAYGPIHIKPLLKGWDDYTETMREILLSIVGENNIREGIPYMLKTLTQKGMPERLIETAVNAIGQIGDADCIDELIGILKKNDEYISRYILAALMRIHNRMGQQFANLLQHRLEDAEPHAAIVELMGRVATEKDISRFTAWARDPQPTVRKAALEALSKWENTVDVETFLYALSDEEATVRVSAARILATRDDENVQKALASATEDPDERVAAAAIESLGMLKSAVAVPTIRKHILGKSPLLAMAALKAISQIKPTDLADILHDASHATDPEVVKEVIKNLEVLDAVQQKKLLEGLLTHEHWSVRITAAQSILAFELTIDPQLINLLYEQETDALVRDVLFELKGGEDSVER